ncbi:arginine deiminase family protein [Caldivirga sp.]|uniref:arginine deiminase family protein n=1 Tax=Caldivirga sp. TaxID=2080243 RepID=UPI003D098A46
MLVRSEWDKLSEVMVHRPGVEMFYGLLYPRAFLYEGVFSMDEALYEHQNMEHVMMSEGVTVHRLKSIVIQRMRHSSEFRETVVSIVKSSIMYKGDLSDDAYTDFLRNLASYDPETLFNILILRPLIIIKRTKTNTIARIINRNPMANLYYTRDQQLVVKTGVVIGRMRMPQRRLEPTITELFFKALNTPIVYKLIKPGFLEGGDFMPMGDFAIVGYGWRSSFNGVKQIMGLLDFDELVMAKLPKHPWGDDMLVMHLDTYFNVAGDGLVIGNEELMKNTHVIVYARAQDGLEKLGESTLLDYIKQRGFKIINLSVIEQAAFASNFLTLKDRRILVPNIEMNIKKMIKRLRSSDDPVRQATLQYVESGYEKMKSEGHIFPYRPDVLNEGVDFITIDVSELVGGYGGVHCATATIRRS